MEFLAVVKLCPALAAVKEVTAEPDNILRLRDHEAQIVLGEHVFDTLRILEPLVVHSEAFYQVFTQTRRRPLAELRAPMAADAETDSQNSLQSVVTKLPQNLTPAFQSNL